MKYGKSKAAETHKTEKYFKHCFAQRKIPMDWCRVRQWMYIEGDTRCGVISDE